MPSLSDAPCHSLQPGQVVSIRTLRGPANAAAVASHRDGLLLLKDILQKLLRPSKLPAIDGLGRLTGVLERDSEVGTAGAGRLGRRNLCSCVPNLYTVKLVVSSISCGQSAKFFLQSPNAWPGPKTTEIARNPRSSLQIVRIRVRRVYSPSWLAVDASGGID